MNTLVDASIEFEGFTRGAEVLGATQADFSVRLPGRHTREVSVLLNEPAAELLAQLLGRENTPEFREEAARQAGALWLERRLAAGAPLESVHFLSRASIEADPGLVDALRALPGRMQPQR